MGEFPHLGISLASACASRVAPAFAGVHDLAQGFLGPHLRAYQSSTPGVGRTYDVVRAIVDTAPSDARDDAVVQVR